MIYTPAKKNPMTHCTFWFTMVSLGEWQPIGLPNNQPCAYESSLLPPFLGPFSYGMPLLQRGGPLHRDHRHEKKAAKEEALLSFFPLLYDNPHFFRGKSKGARGANLDVRKLFLPRNSPRQMRSTFRIRITQIKSKVSDLPFVSKKKTIWNWRIPLLDRVSGPLNERRSGVPSELYI